MAPRLKMDCFHTRGGSFGGDFGSARYLGIGDAAIGGFLGIRDFPGGWGVGIRKGGVGWLVYLRGGVGRINRFATSAAGPQQHEADHYHRTNSKNHRMLHALTDLGGRGFIQD